MLRENKNKGKGNDTRLLFISSVTAILLFFAGKYCGKLQHRNCLREGRDWCNGNTGKLAVQAVLVQLSWFPFLPFYSSLVSSIYVLFCEIFVTLKEIFTLHIQHSNG